MVTKVEMNEVELRLLEEIRDGRKEFKGDVEEGTFLNLFYLQKVFGFVKFDALDGGVENVELTDNGRYFFNPEQQKIEGLEWLRKILDKEDLDDSSEKE